MQLPTITLDRADPLKIYTVTEINTDGAMTDRLRALGLIPGTTVKVRIKSRNCNIASYDIRGAQIAFRGDIAGQISVAEAALFHDETNKN